MAFTTVIEWQGDPEWIVETRITGFETAKEAANYGASQGPKSADRLVLSEKKLFIIEGDGQQRYIPFENVAVRRLKNGGHENEVVSPYNFKRISLSPEEFCNDLGLSHGFTLFSFRVLDEENSLVDAKADPIDPESLKGDIISFIDLLKALEAPETKMTYALVDDEVFLGDFLVIGKNTQIVDAKIATLAIQEQMVQKISLTDFQITSRGLTVLKNFRRAMVDIALMPT